MANLICANFENGGILRMSRLSISQSILNFVKLIYT
jgi:hypothetical protein